MAPEVKTLSAREIHRGLAAIDSMIGNSDLLMSVAPIRIMVAGGVLAVTLLGTREATNDVDFILDPDVDQDKDYRSEFFDAVRTSSDVVPPPGALPKGWLNDNVRLFMGSAEQRRDLFQLSAHRGLTVYDGKNLTAYAATPEWALETKLSRIQVLGEDDVKRRTDVDDAVALVRLLVESGGGGEPLSAGFLRGLNFKDDKTRPPVERAIAAVAQAYEATHGSVGIRL